MRRVWLVAYVPREPNILGHAAQSSTDVLDVRADLPYSGLAASAPRREARGDARIWECWLVVTSLSSG